MEKLVKTGRLFYCIAIAGVGAHQLFYSNFCLMLFPAWPIHFPGSVLFAWIGSLALICASIAIVLGKKARTASLILGGSLLLLFCLSYFPYEIFVSPYSKHMGTWVNPLKELALAGGAFVIAGSYQYESKNKGLVFGLLEKFIPFGGIFFSITMTTFGIGHFLYAQFVSKLVPGWMPDPLFWTYFAGVALIASGVAIILEIRLRPIAILLGIMIFIWLIVLHIPRALTLPLLDDGNEITSAFSALAFSGTAFVISGNNHKINFD